jgi:hypothetical protein
MGAGLAGELVSGPFKAPSMLPDVKAAQNTNCGSYATLLQSRFDCKFSCVHKGVHMK